MVVLRAIGSFFKKIWDWIRQTAWIQPLLIVGVIFGVIFSIPSIVKAVQAGKKEKSTYAAYYHNYKLSLEGGETSDADKFTYDLFAVMRDNKVNEFKEAHPDLGDKFFVMYVEKDCKECEDAKAGFKYFEDKFSNYVSKDETNEFHLVTIFADDETSETTETETAFFQYLDRHEDFFAEVGSAVAETEYYKAGLINSDTLEHFETANPEEFLTPTLMLVELGELAESRGFNSGVTELSFGLNGNSTKFDQAKFLGECWSHTGVFSNNPED